MISLLRSIREMNKEIAKKKKSKCSSQEERENIKLTIELLTKRINTLTEDVIPFIIIQDAVVQKVIKAYFFDCNEWYDIPECMGSDAMRKIIERACEAYDRKKEDSKK